MNCDESRFLSTCDVPHRHVELPDRLRVSVAANGRFDVRTMGRGIAVPHETRTYTNAATWADGDEVPILDRSSGQFEGLPNGSVDLCEKIGGQKVLEATRWPG